MTFTAETSAYMSPVFLPAFSYHTASQKFANPYLKGKNACEGKPPICPGIDSADTAANATPLNPPRELGHSNRIVSPHTAARRLHCNLSVVI